MPRFIKEIIKNKEKPNEMVPNRYRKTYMLFKNDFGLLQVDKRNFIIENYIKEDAPKNIITEPNLVFDNSITLFKKYLQKIAINVNAKKVIFLDNIYVFSGARDLLKVDLLLQIENLPYIYFSVSDLPPLKHKKLFWGLNSIDRTIEMLSYKDGVFNERKAKFNTFVAYTILFFIDQIHEYFLDLLKSKRSIRLDMTEADFTLTGSFVIDYNFTSISKNFFEHGTYVYKSKGKKYSVKDILLEFVKKYVTYLSTSIGGKINPDIYKNMNKDLFLYYLAVHAFFVYILAYVYTFIDLRRIFNDLVTPRLLGLEVNISKSNGICLKPSNLSDYKCIKTQLLRDSLVVKILRGKSEIKLKSEGQFFGFSIEEEVQSFSLEWAQKQNRKKIQNKEARMFFLSSRNETPYVYCSYNVESFIFFLRKIVKEDSALDLFYKYIYEIMQLGLN